MTFVGFIVISVETGFNKILIFVEQVYMVSLSSADTGHFRSQLEDIDASWRLEFQNSHEYASSLKSGDDTG